MSKVSRTLLKGYFESGDKPTAAQFANLIDSFLSLNDDNITIDMVQGLTSALAGKATMSQVSALIGDITTLVNVPVESRNTIVSVLQYISANAGGAKNPTEFTVALGSDNHTGLPDGTVIGVNADPWAILMGVLRKATPPTYNLPTSLLTGAPAPAVVEVGTALAIAFVIGYTQNDGGAQTAKSMTKNGVALVADGNGAYADNITAGLSAISYRATVAYAQGAIKNNSLGTPDASGRVGAGSALSNTLSYQGSYKVFFGATDTVITGANVRTALVNSIWLSGATIDFPSGNAAKNFYIAVPPGHTLSSWIDSTALGADLKGPSTNSVVNVPDGGVGTLAYTLYKLSNGAPYDAPGDNFKFVIA